MTLVPRLDTACVSSTVLDPKGRTVKEPTKKYHTALYSLVQVGNICKKKKNVKVGNDQKIPSPKPRWEKTRSTFRYLYDKHTVGCVSSFFPIGSHSFTVSTKNMKTYIRRIIHFVYKTQPIYNKSAYIFLKRSFAPF